MSLHLCNLLINAEKSKYIYAHIIQSFFYKINKYLIISQKIC